MSPIEHPRCGCLPATMQTARRRLANTLASLPRRTSLLHIERRCVWNLVARPQKRSVSLTRHFPHPREDVFAIIADVASYSEFLPFCQNSRILSRHADGGFDAQLSLGFLAFSEAYVSRVQLTPPSAIVANASNTPLFEQLTTTWRFKDGITPGTCEAHFELTMLLRSIMHDHALAGVIDGVAAEQVAAFTRRCDQIISRDGADAMACAGADAQDTAASLQVASASAAPVAGVPPSPPAEAAVAERAVQALAVEPAWRQRVDAAFDAHAVDGTLTLGRFVEACRHLGLTGALAQPAAADGSRHLRERHGGINGSGGDAAEPMPEVLLAAWFVEFDDNAVRAGPEHSPRQGLLAGESIAGESIAFAA